MMTLAKTKKNTVPPVEDLARVHRCGGLKCIQKTNNEGRQTTLISDGTRLYPSVASSLTLPHFHVSHGKGVWVIRCRRGRLPSIIVHSGTIDNFWAQLKNGIPKSIHLTLDAKTQKINPQVMEYVNQFSMRWHNQDVPPQDLMKLVGQHVLNNLIQYV